MYRLLHLPAARLFVLVVGLWLSGVLLSGALGLATVGEFSVDRDLGTAAALLAAMLRAAARVTVILWLAAVTAGLRPNRVGTADNSFALALATGYMVAYSVAVCVLPVTLERGLPGAGGGAFLSAHASQFASFALASYVLLAYKAAVSLEAAEDYSRTNTWGRWRDWLGFLVFVLGVWPLQPRVRAAVAMPAEVALEDHLVG